MFGRTTVHAHGLGNANSDMLIVTFSNLSYPEQTLVFEWSVLLLVQVAEEWAILRVLYAVGDIRRLYSIAIVLYPGQKQLSCDCTDNRTFLWHNISDVEGLSFKD